MSTRELYAKGHAALRAARHLGQVQAIIARHFALNIARV